MNRDFTRYQKLPEIDLRSLDSRATKTGEQTHSPTVTSDTTSLFPSEPERRASLGTMELPHPLAEQCSALRRRGGSESQSTNLDWEKSLPAGEGVGIRYFAAGQTTPLRA